jgi:hypothetical protein
MAHHLLNRKICTLLIVALLGMVATAQKPPMPNDTAKHEDSIVVKLVTFYPGDEVFAVYGHTDLRVTQGKHDYYYNYGVFDFKTPNFVYRFVRGDAEYMCGVLPPNLAAYGMDGRRMIEQRLNLTQQQAHAVRDYLVINSLPGNNTYCYQYLGDNCSTRPRDIIEMALGDSLHYAPVTDFVTYRDMMSHYTANYPWEQFGIDLVLGPRLDQPLDERQRMFIPMALMQAYDHATVTRDGQTQPLVIDTQVMVDGSEQGTVLPPTPWWRTPIAAALLMLVITVAMTVRDLRRRKVTRWFDTVLYTLYAMVGCVLFFLMFCSVREATWPNYNAFWANPFMLFPAVAVWFASARSALKAYHWINLMVIVLLMLAWYWIPQVANPAFFPLMALPAIRSANFLLINRCNS